MIVIDWAGFAFNALWVLGADRYGAGFWKRLADQLVEPAGTGNVANEPKTQADAPVAGRVSRPVRTRRMVVGSPWMTD